jgi:hypothetical protein
MRPRMILPTYTTDVKATGSWRSALPTYRVRHPDPSPSRGSCDTGRAGETSLAPQALDGLYLSCNTFRAVHQTSLAEPRAAWMTCNYHSTMCLGVADHEPQVGRMRGASDGRSHSIRSLPVLDVLRKVFAGDGPAGGSKTGQ